MRTRAGTVKGRVLGTDRKRVNSQEQSLLMQRNIPIALSPNAEKKGSIVERLQQKQISSPAHGEPEQRTRRRKRRKRGSDNECLPPGSRVTPGSCTNSGSTMDISNPDAHKPSTTLPSTMKVMLSPHLVIGHCYCSISDSLRLFPGPGLTKRFILVNNQTVLKVSPDAAVSDGYLGLDYLDLRDVGVSENDDVRVARYIPDKLVMLSLQLQTVRYSVKFRDNPEMLDMERLKARFISEYEGKLMTVGNWVFLHANGTDCTFKVKKTMGKQVLDSKGGVWTSDTHIILESQGDAGIAIPHQQRNDSGITSTNEKGGGSDVQIPGITSTNEKGGGSDVQILNQTGTNEKGSHSGIQTANQTGGGRRNLFKTNDFSFQNLGIGGLDDEFEDIFRRAFASRLFQPDVIQKLGIKHVKGMLLWGPPGTGKTLIARQIGKMLHGKEPKVVNGPELLSKWWGETERKTRELFADAEYDQKIRGDEGDLHIIIFDEIDAICKTRGSLGSSSVVNDGIVNQLLTKIDGVDSLNNILVIGMTNRKDLLDEALLRPGRLEVHIQIGLPDEKGRAQILHIHSSKMQQSSCLSDNVDLVNLAARTKNFSGAELEGLVRSATSFALSRHVNFEDLNKSTDGNIKVMSCDFEKALDEIIPAFGAGSANLERCRINSMLDCGPRSDHVLKTAKILVDEVKRNEHTPLLSCLLEGPRGSGKTALAATIALESEAPFIKMITAKSMVSLSESTKCELINKVFEDAYKSLVSLIIIDDIERIIEYVDIGPRFSNLILQTLLVLMGTLPPKGRKLLIIGTTSMKQAMGTLDMLSAFNVSIPVPMLSPTEIRKVLLGLNVFAPEEVDEAVSVVGGEVPIKRLLMLIGMSKQDGSGQGSSDKIDLRRFQKCFNDLGH